MVGGQHEHLGRPLPSYITMPPDAAAAVPQINPPPPLPDTPSISLVFGMSFCAGFELLRGYFAQVAAGFGAVKLAIGTYNVRTQVAEIVVRQCLSLCFHCLRDYDTAFALCGVTAFVATTLPLLFVFSLPSCYNSAFTLCVPLPTWLRECLCLLCSTTFAAETVLSPCVFHCLRGYDSAFALCVPLPPWPRQCLCLVCFYCIRG